MATFSDDFTRADAGTLGANWTEDATGFSIVSNAADSDGTTSVAWYATQTDTDDNYSEVTTGSANSNPNQVFCRGDGSTGSPTAYGVQVNATTPLITKYVSGTRTTLTSDWGSQATADTMKIEANGSTITAYHNGVSAAALTDTSITTGKYLGFRAGATTTVYRDWNGGDLASGDATFTTTATSDTAAGGTTSFTGGATFTTVEGAATAAGGTTSFTGGAGFTTVVGEATAAGGATSFTGGATFTTVVAGSTAEGGVTSFSGGAVSATFTTLVAAATAAGGTGSFIGTSLNATFTTTAGDAAASGGTRRMYGGNNPRSRGYRGRNGGALLSRSHAIGSRSA